MKKDNKEKSLVKVKGKNFWDKVINFFKKKKQENVINTKLTNNELKKDIQKEKFREYVGNIENEETQLIKLQKKYRSGEIKENELTQTQIRALCDLYDKQIENLQKSNELRKQKILQLKKRL